MSFLDPSYKIVVGSETWEPEPISSNSPVVNHRFKDAMFQPPSLYILLEKPESAYPINMYDEVEFWEENPSGTLIQTWRGQVRNMEPVGDGQIEVTCFGKRDHLTGAVADRLLYENLVDWEFLGFIYQINGFPAARLSHTDFQTPFLRADHIPLLDLSGNNNYIETSREPAYTGGFPPPNFINMFQTSPANKSGTKIAINFKGPETPLSFVEFLMRLDVISVPGGETIDLDWEIWRLDSPSGKPVTPSPSGQTLIMSGTWSTATDKAWDYYPFPTAAELFAGATQYQPKRLEPNENYLFIIHADSNDTTHQFELHVAYEDLENYTGAVDWPGQSMSFFTFPAAIWTEYHGRSAYLKWWTQGVFPMLQHKDYSLVFSTPFWYLVLDRDRFGWYDAAWQFADGVAVGYFRGSVDSKDACEAIFQHSGLDLKEVSLAGSYPVVDLRAATMLDVLEGILPQNDLQLYTRSDFWPGVRALPSGAATISYDYGESGIVSRAKIVRHTIGKKAIDVKSQFIVEAVNPSQQPIVYFLQNSLSSSLDEPTDGSAIIPGFKSFAEIKPSGLRTLQQLVEIAELEDSKQTYELWQGDIEVDDVRAGPSGTGLIPGDKIHVRDDKEGLDDDLRIVKLNRGRYTTTFTVSTEPQDLIDAIRQLDRRLNLTERTSIPESLDRSTRMQFVDTLVGGTETEFISTAEATWRDYSWARLEDSSGFAVTPWIRSTSVYTVDGDNRYACWYFPKSWEQTRRSRVIDKLHVDARPDGDTGTPDWDFTTSFDGLADEVDIGHGIIVLLKATK